LDGRAKTLTNLPKRKKGGRRPTPHKKKTKKERRKHRFSGKTKRETNKPSERNISTLSCDFSVGKRKKKSTIMDPDGPCK